MNTNIGDATPCCCWAISPKSDLVRTEDMLAKLYPVYETRDTFLLARCRSPVLDLC